MAARERAGYGLGESEWFSFFGFLSFWIFGFLTRRPSAPGRRIFENGENRNSRERDSNREVSSNYRLQSVS